MNLVLETSTPIQQTTTKSYTRTVDVLGGRRYTNTNNNTPNTVPNTKYHYNTKLKPIQPNNTQEYKRSTRTPLQKKTIRNAIHRTTNNTTPTIDVLGIGRYNKTKQCNGNNTPTTHIPIHQYNIEADTKAQCEHSKPNNQYNTEYADTTHNTGLLYANT